MMDSSSLRVAPIASGPMANTNRITPRMPLAQRSSIRLAVIGRAAAYGKKKAVSSSGNGFSKIGGKADLSLRIREDR